MTRPTGGRWSRRGAARAALGLLAALLSPLRPRDARAFGEAGAFNPRLLTTGGRKVSKEREAGAARWAWELVRRTSAPARLLPTRVAAGDAALFEEPFVVWAGDTDVPALTGAELRGLREYLRLGGVMVVDDLEPASGAFGRAARRELTRVLPDASVVDLDPRHVIYKSYYILERPVGRVLGPARLQAIIRGKDAQVIFTAHDLLGAMARSGETWTFPVEPGGAEQRQLAIRLAVNLAMYALCSDYKDDQVHAPWLMRRRARQ